MEQMTTSANRPTMAVNKQSTRPKQRMTTRKAVGLGCLIAVLGPLLLIGWGIFGYFNAPQPAWSVAWSPDGKQLAAGYGGYGGSDIPGPPQDDTVRVWDTGNGGNGDLGNTGKPVEVLTRHTARVMGVAFSPDGRWLASGDEWGKALLWDRQDLKSRPTVLDDDVYPDTGSQHLTFSEDSHWLAGGGGSFQEVGVWDVTDPLASSVGLIAPEAYVSFAGFLPDNKTLVAVSDEGRVGLWDRTAPGAKPTLLPKGGGGQPGVQDVGGVSVVAISPDGGQIAGAGDEGTMWLWDVKHPDASPVSLSGKLQGSARSIDYSPDGKHLVASASDEYGKGKTLMWDLADKIKEPGEVRGAESNTTDLKFSPDGKWLAASGYEGTVRVWQADQLGANPKILGR